MSAHDNATAKRHWITLRVTALLNIPLVFWLVYTIIDLIGATHVEFTDWLARPVNALLMIVLIISVFWHAALGVHEIIEDYVHDDGLKNKILRLKAAAFFVLGTFCVISILKILFLE